MTSPAAPASRAGIARPIPPPASIRRILWIVASGAALVAFWHLDIDLARLRALPRESFQYLSAMFLHADWSQFDKALAATVASIQMAWVGTVLGAVLSLPLAFLAARNVTPAWIRYPIQFLFDVIRAIPELILAIAILAVTGLTPFTGALAIGIHSIGTLGKLSFEAIEAIEAGPIEAARSTGATRGQIMRWGMWTQVQPEILSIWLYRFEVNVRAGAVLGLIGAGGVGQMLIENIRYRRWEVIGVLLIVVIVTTILIDLASGTVRTKIISGRWPWQQGAGRSGPTIPREVAA